MQTWTPPTGRARSRTRRRLALVLVVVASLLAPLAVDAWWVRHTVLDTDRFVEELGPLAEDPEVQDFVAAALTDQLVDALDLGSRAGGVLPPGIGSLVDGPIDRAAEELIGRAATTAVRSALFPAVWERSLEVSHRQLVALLTGESRGVTAQDGVVVLDLSPLVTAAVAELDQRGLGDLVPDLSGLPLQITLFESDALGDAQWFVALLDRTGSVLPVVVLALWAVAVVVSSDRWRTLMAGGATLMAAMVVHLGALLLGRSLYLDAVTTALPEATARSIYRILLETPRTATIVGIALGAAIGLLGVAGVTLTSRRPSQRM